MAPENKRGAGLALTIRPFQPSDSAALSEILRESAEAAQWPVESYATLAASCTGLLLLVCEGSSQVTGFLAGRRASDEAEILNLAVRTDFRRKGAATKLLITALDIFQGSGVTRVFLELRASNRAAHALYERHGFMSSGSRKAYYRDPPEDAICMHKNFRPVLH